MKWASALSLKPRLGDALRECAASLEEAHGPPDLAILFVTPHFSRDFEEAPGLLQRLLGPKRLIGCSAGGVIAGGAEAENRTATALVAAWLPGARVLPFRLQAEELPDMDAPPRAWQELVGVAEKGAAPHFVLLADPFSFNPEDLLRGLDYAFPAAVKVGGLSSGASRPGGNALFLGEKCFRSGAVGAAFMGNVRIDPLVAQGCRPIGKPLKITGCEENQLLELDGRPTLEALEDIFKSLSGTDQELARHSLFLGLLTTPFREGRSKRDYLIRNIVGVQEDKGTLAIGTLLRPGQMVQFHVRDRHASAEDLKALLGRYAAAKPRPEPAGALLFSCLGRGQHLYGVPNHDTGLFLKSVGVPLGGFFCNGEIGPVDSATYLHGYTSCFGIFRPAN